MEETRNINDYNFEISEMEYKFKDIKFRELTEEEQKSFKEDGFIGDEGGDGYLQRTVAYFSKDYALPYKGKEYLELFEVELEQVVVGGLYGSTHGAKVVEGLADSNTDVFFIVNPTICSTGFVSTRKVYDDFEDAIDYYQKLLKFAETLKVYKSK